MNETEAKAILSMNDEIAALKLQNSELQKDVASMKVAVAMHQRAEKKLDELCNEKDRLNGEQEKALKIVRDGLRYYDQGHGHGHWKIVLEADKLDAFVAILQATERPKCDCPCHVPAPAADCNCCTVKRISVLDQVRKFSDTCSTHSVTDCITCGLVVSLPGNAPLECSECGEVDCLRDHLR